MTPGARRALAPRPGRWSRRPWWLDCLGIAGLVGLFYAPLLAGGLPGGDFASDVAMSAVQADLLPRPWSLATWNPYLMCGRPTIGFWSPFRVLNLPFLPLDPILRMKALVVLFHVLGGLTMYALLRRVRAGADAALLGGAVYPIMASHIARSSLHGHVHLPMFWALLPLVFLALFRLRARDPRPVLVLGLVLAASFLRDTQRTVLLVTMLGLLLAGRVVLGLRDARRRLKPAAWLLVLVGLASALAVGIESFELVNGYLGDAYRGGWRPGEQQASLEKWAVDNLYSYVDVRAFLALSFRPSGADFSASMSRYLGLSLLLYALLAALAVDLGPHRDRFWLVFLLLPLSAWLSFGLKPVFPEVRERWTRAFASPAVGWPPKVVVLAMAALFLAWAIVVARRRVGRRRGGLVLAILAVLGVLALFLGTAPLAVLRRTVFYLRDFRNPDWFQVAVSSFAVAFAASFLVTELERRFGGRRWWPAAFLALLALPVLDLAAYRPILTRGQGPPELVRNLRDGYRRIGEDPGDFRVLGSDSYGNLEDLGYLWHRKRLAFDFRSYTAPRRNLELMRWYVPLLGMRAQYAPAELAGLANIKYLVDTWPFEMVQNRDLELCHASPEIRVYENLRYRPLVSVFPQVQVSQDRSVSKVLVEAASLARRGVGVLHLSSREGIAPPPPEVLARMAPVEAAASPQPVALSSSPETLSWSRPRPDRLVIHTTNPAEVLLHVSESFHPRWRAWTNGSPTAIYPSGYAFLGVLVPAGAHTVELRYEPPAGFWLWGVLGLLLLGASLLALWLLPRPADPGALLVDGPE